MKQISTNSRGLRARRAKIYAAGKGRCFYCGAVVTSNLKPLDRDWLLLKPSMMVVEHKVPVIRGGSNGDGNLVCSCSPCNATKGAFTLDEFRLVIAYRNRYLDFRFPGENVEHTPRRDWLVCHSDRQYEREIVIHNFPAAVEGYEMQRNAYARGKAARGADRAQ